MDANGKCALSGVCCVWRCFSSLMKPRRSGSENGHPRNEDAKPSKRTRAAADGDAAVEAGASLAASTPGERYVVIVQNVENDLARIYRDAIPRFVLPLKRSETEAHP